MPENSQAIKTRIILPPSRERRRHVADFANVVFL
jgi:hypothetical protein